MRKSELSLGGIVFGLAIALFVFIYLSFSEISWRILVEWNQSETEILFDTYESHIFYAENES